IRSPGLRPGPHRPRPPPHGSRLGRGRADPPMIKTLPPRRRRSSPVTEPPIVKAGESKGSAMDLNEIKRLIQLVQKSGIGELEVSEGERTIRITAAPLAAGGPVAYAAAPAQSAPAPAP